MRVTLFFLFMLSTYAVSYKWESQAINNVSTVPSYFSAAVGIMTTTPEVYEDTADDFVIYGTGHSGLTIRSGSSSTGNVYFADGETDTKRYDGFFQYNHATRQIQIGAEGSNALVVGRNADSYFYGEGNVGVGTNSPAYNFHVKSLTTSNIPFAVTGSLNDKK